MLETITAGLLLASVSGITYLAYKHPRAYRKIALPLSTLILLIQFMVMMWSFGVQATHLKLMPLIESSKWNQAQEAVDGILPRWWLVALVCLGATTYLLLLYWLPKLLDQEKKDSPDEPSPEKKDENV
jgi:TRAP-type C4-dicarboxylate transport system permease small subunit